MTSEISIPAPATRDAVSALVAPWLAALRRELGTLELFDAHTHIGANDPDGFRQSAPELGRELDDARAVGAFVFPMHEPQGYPPANDAVLAHARSDDRLVPFCRVDPHDDALAEARRALDAGARGIKLHPRAEGFTLDHAAVDGLAALAVERGVPILVHAGRGIPALGEHAVALCGRRPELRLILAHAGICDLAWIWRAAPEHPNLLFDTSWWLPADLGTLMRMMPPGQVLFASDAPYAPTAASAVFALRTALQAGLSADQVRSIASGQSLHLAGGEAPAPCGPAPGEREEASHVLLERVSQFLLLGTVLTFRGGDGSEMIALARLGCDVPDSVDDAPIFASIRALLDAHARLTAHEPGDRSALPILILAAHVARTPDVPLPVAGD